MRWNRSFAWLLSLVFLAITPAYAQDYIPLAVGNRWVLRDLRHADKPFIIEITQQNDRGYRFTSTTPWGRSGWTLVNRGGKYFMTEYGNSSDQWAPIPDGTLYFDFSSPAGSKWSNQLGAHNVVSTSLQVRSASRTFDHCIQIKHSIGKSDTVFTFAPGVGFVQFGEGAGAFVLDEASSSLPGAGISASVDTGRSRPEIESRPAPPRMPHEQSSRPLFGMTANQLATDPGPQAMVQRFEQVKALGAKYIVANGSWHDLEPKKNQYQLDSLNYLVSVARPAGMEISYTLRIINTVDRDVPDELKRTSWGDPKMQERLFALLDSMAPMLKGNVQWFMLGYEINEYLNRHPAEANDFMKLYRAAEEHLQRSVPGIRVSTTLMYSGLDQLNGRLSALNPNMEFLALTYTPLEADFGVRDPSVLPSDFSRMKEFAHGRPIVFQEIGYPSSPVTGSSEDKQAQFYRLAFKEFNSDPSAFSAVNWMMLGDLSDSATKQFSAFYGLKGAPKFEASLQTLGVFDKNGQPKKSWQIFGDELKGK